MNHFVLFIGAGASRPFGIPTMTEMARQFEEELQEESARGDGSAHYDLFDIVKSRLQEYRSFDIEALVTVLQDILQYEEAPAGFLNHPSVHFFLIGEKGLSSAIAHGKSLAKKHRDAAEKLLAKVKNFVVRACMIKTEAFDLYEELLEQVMQRDGYNFKKLLNQRVGNINCEIFTTNYDIVLEKYCYKSYLDRQSGEGDNQLLRMGKDNRKLFNPEEGAFKVYKLHGSINWYQDENGRLCWLTQPARVGAPTLLGGQIARELLIYPASQKYTFREPFYYMFHYLKERLTNCEVCYVVGYSFRDEDILGLFMDSMSLNSHLILCLIDPVAEDIAAEKFGDFERRVKRIPKEFSIEAIQELAKVEGMPRHYSPP
jgi:hypothetical protein